MMTFEDFHPQPERSEIIATQKLYAVICQLIAKKGPLSFAEYMALSLYHREHGYYSRDAFDIGKKGDFTTAPEISPLFAECFANQFKEVFASSIKKNILELGAGTGRFTHDILQHLALISCLPEHYYIYEISENLRKKQQYFLRMACPNYYSRIEWLSYLPENFEGIVFANEVLDALPVHCFRIENQVIRERLVTVEKNQLNWKISDPLENELLLFGQKLQNRYALPNDYESEVNLKLPLFIAELTQCIDRAVIFLVDYGFGQKEYYRPERKEGTLSCFYKQQKYTNPFIFPGLQDITAHVDFTYVIENASEQGCKLLGFTTQAAFLLACGLIPLANEKEKHLTVSAKVNLHQAIKQLTFPSEMGELIKVIALGKNIDLSLSGFTLMDRRRDL